MKVFIGHYYGAPDEWFLAWGRTKEEAALEVDGSIGEPDLRSMRELKEPGLVDLKVVKEDIAEGEGQEELIYYLAEIGDDEVDPDRQDEGKHYDNEVEIEDDVSEWIRKCIEEPFGVANQSPDPVSHQLGIHQNELIDLYKPHEGE